MGSCMGTPQNLPTEQRQLWQDRQIRWDQPKGPLVLRLGEEILQKFENVEDSKGENGLGSISVTNLRFIWVANHNSKLNLSIGLGNVAYVHFNMIDSPTFGRLRASHMMTQLSNTRFEFTFATRADVAMALFNMLDNALRRYRATRVFRDLVLRDERLTKDGEAVIYYGEELLLKVDDCENLTTEEKFSGLLVITNQRFLWTSVRNRSINVSVPYVQFRAVGTRTSNFGSALVIETTAGTGGYVLGFKFANPAILTQVQQLLVAHFNARKVSPFYGPLDGQVQYIDDRLVVVQESTGSPATTASSQTVTTSSPVLTQAPSEASPPSPLALLTSRCLDPGMHEDGEMNLLSDSSSPELRSPLRDSPTRIGEPINLRFMPALPIGVENGQASVVYSEANRAAATEAEMLLNISPSSRKYRAPKCVVCMAKGTEAAFDPCGHLCSCMSCAPKLKHCPICRSEVTKILRIYLQAA